MLILNLAMWLLGRDMAIIETWDDNENECSFFRCDCCKTELNSNDTNRFDDEFCSAHCWFISDRRELKKWLLLLIEKGWKDVDNIFAHIESYGFIFSEEMSQSSVVRFKRAIQNRINKKAAQSAVTLKAA